MFDDGPLLPEGQWSEMRRGLESAGVMEWCGFFPLDSWRWSVVDAVCVEVVSAAALFGPGGGFVPDVGNSDPIRRGHGNSFVVSVSGIAHIHKRGAFAAVCAPSFLGCAQGE